MNINPAIQSEGRTYSCFFIQQIRDLKIHGNQIKFSYGDEKASWPTIVYFKTKLGAYLTGLHITKRLIEIDRYLERLGHLKIKHPSPEIMIPDYESNEEEEG